MVAALEGEHGDKMLTAEEAAARAGGARGFEARGRRGEGRRAPGGDEGGRGDPARPDGRRRRVPRRRGPARAEAPGAGCDGGEPAAGLHRLHTTTGQLFRGWTRTGATTSPSASLNGVSPA